MTPHLKEYMIATGLLALFGFAILFWTGDFLLRWHEIDMSIYKDKIIFENENGTFYLPILPNRTDSQNVTYVTIPNSTEVPAGVFL